MAYQDNETSLNDGSPRELYKFIGTYNTYRYTSAQETIVSGGETYTPIYITRNTLKIASADSGENALEISLPFNNPLVTAYAYQNAPPDLTLELRRCHETDPNDTVMLWSGKVTGFTVEGRVAKLRVPAAFSYIIQGNTPTPRFQAPCNHVLFDARCGVNPALHQHVTTIVSVVGNVLQLASLPFSEDEAAAGQIFNAGGEQRMVIANLGTSVTVTYEFANLNPGDTVTIRKGCDHAFEGHCKTRFSNGDRFGGFPLVPDRNPFSSTLT